MVDGKPLCLSRILFLQFLTDGGWEQQRMLQLLYVKIKGLTTAVDKSGYMW
jgi:hypothetical protein